MPPIGNAVKITVLKKMSAKDVYGHLLPEMADDVPTYCERMEEGQEFIMEGTGVMPVGFCTWAWHDIYPEITVLRFGGNFPWVKKKGLIYSCCTDGMRPVFFKLERL